MHFIERQLPPCISSERRAIPRDADRQVEAIRTAGGESDGNHHAMCGPLPVAEAMKTPDDTRSSPPAARATRTARFGASGLLFSMRCALPFRCCRAGGGATPFVRFRCANAGGKSGAAVAARACPASWTTRCICDSRAALTSGTRPVSSYPRYYWTWGHRMTCEEKTRLAMEGIRRSYCEVL